MNLSKTFDFLEKIANCQINFSYLAIRGAGDYDISKHFSRYKVSLKVWQNSSNDDKLSLFKNFLKRNIFEINPNITKSYYEKNIQNKINYNKKNSKKEIIDVAEEKYKDYFRELCSDWNDLS